MKITKEQWSMILSAVIAFVVAIAGAFGYNAVRSSQPAAGPQVVPTAVLGPYYESLTVGKDMKSLGSATFAKATITNLTGTTITATTLISQSVSFQPTGDGSAAAPAFSFADDANTGLYRIGTDNIGIATNGTKAFDVSATAATSALPVVHPVGSAAAPAATFTGDTNSGIYRVGADDVGVATNGTLAFDVSTTAATSALPVVHPLGSAAAPAVTFTGDTNTGIYDITADDVGISAGGTLRFDVSATAATSTLPIVHPVGSAAAPAVTFASDTNTGIYRVGADDVGIATNGVLALDVSATTVTSALPVVVNGALNVAGTVTFTGPNIYSSASITPTDGSVLTPTARMVTLTPAVAVGVEMGACTTGNETILYNAIAQNVVITDTNNGVLAGNQTLGQYDTLHLACFASKWVQVGPVSAN